MSLAPVTAAGPQGPGGVGCHKCSLQCWLLLQHVQTLVYGGQAAFDATVQTLQTHYARTDNSLRMIHLSVWIHTDK